MTVEIHMSGKGDFMHPRELLRASMNWAKLNLSQALFPWVVIGLFLMSGVHSLLDWPATMEFFHVGYRINRIWPIAAVISTAAELALPIFLIFGLLPRFSVCGLLLINTLAIIWFGSQLDGLTDTSFQLRLMVEGILAMWLWHGWEL
ncbi:DoxX family protein [Oceanisphaera sp. KMM 10153]|uniref:DoxX family protein n=1 Tax=Oceanisphaera submarina TaxID=3390193 RepID=UPI003975FE65